MGSSDDYIRDLEKLLEATDAKSKRAEELKGEWLRGQLEALRKAIKMTPRDFNSRFGKDPKATIALMVGRYKRISKSG